MANNKSNRFLIAPKALIGITQFCACLNEWFMKFWEHKVGQIPGSPPCHLSRTDVWPEIFIFFKLLPQVHLHIYEWSWWWERKERKRTRSTVTTCGEWENGSMGKAVTTQAQTGLVQSWSVWVVGDSQDGLAAQLSFLFFPLSCMLSDFSEVVTIDSRSGTFCSLR